MSRTFNSQAGHADFWLPSGHLFKPWRPLKRVAGVIIVLMTFCSGALKADDAPTAEFPEVFNTEAAGQHPPSPDEMVGLIEVPKGFQVTLFAAEPQVQQPICMDFDEHGRLWVAENYSYSGGPYETKLRDRVVVFEDIDGDGRHDSRRVFWDKGFMLTSLIRGFGGLWILHDGTLSFIPDKDQDCVPDGEPVVMLDGWSKDCGHNFVSGLIWGPDGWLYGRHGIVDTSWPGIPGTPREERPFMNCGIWRYHPVSRRFEVVCNGTTNPWGLDYNEDGQFFMTNNVQGHLWHIIPGAHYQRMYGQDFNPHAYELMDMTADHYHWDTRGKWTDSRDGKAMDYGGGHSHVGGLIYHGDNFPKEYHGKIFMCNTHGRSINVDRLDRQGSGYVGKHEPNFMQVKTPWFRGVDLKAGPEGAIYVADWSDNGECHDHDGIHRTSGRIYRISWGTPGKKKLDATEFLNADGSHRCRSDWSGRQSRRLLQEAEAGLSDSNKTSFGVTGFRSSEGAARQNVRAFLFYESLGKLQDADITAALESTDDMLCAQAVQLAAGDEKRRIKHVPEVLRIADKPQPANVLMALASVLQKLPSEQRWQLAEAILTCEANAKTIAGDNPLTLMMWYGIEPTVFNSDVLKVLRHNSKLQQFAVRRMAHEITSRPEVASSVLRYISSHVAAQTAADEDAAVALLTAFKAGLAGRARVTPPGDWTEIESQLRQSKNKEITLAVDSLGILFGDGAAIADLRALAGNPMMDPVAREQAVQALAQSRDAESLPMFYNLLGDRAIYGSVIRALVQFDQQEIPGQLLARISGFKDGNRGLAIDTLSSRKSFALELIAAIESGKIDARELTAAQVRQLQAFQDDHINSVIASRWGVVQETSAAKAESLERWKKYLTPEVLAAADRDHGATLFRKSCAGCHKLYGEGNTIGPDITGANRSNLEYLLINMIDPSSVVPRQFTTSVIQLKDGRILTGVIVGETDETQLIQTEKEQVSISRSEIEESRNTGKSLMPDGQLDTLTPQQVRDLLGFVMYRR